MSAPDVARAFGLGSPTAELNFVARGAMGEVFRLDTEDGPVAVKRLLWGPSGDEEANAAFQYAAADAGVRMARPLPTTNGDVLKRLGDGWWRAYEWVEGTHVPVGDSAPATVAAAVARNLGTLHSLKYDTGEPVDGWFTGVGDDQIAAALDAAGSVGVDVTGARRALAGLGPIARMRPNETPVGCHNDPDRGNVIVGAADGSVALIDWDNAGSNCPASELAGALWQWSNGSDSEVVAAMVRAYRDAGGVFEPSGLEVFAPVCAAWVNYAVSCCLHLVDDRIDAGTLAFERPVVDQLANYDVTVATLERILEMVPA